MDFPACRRTPMDSQKTMSFMPQIENGEYIRNMSYDKNTSQVQNIVCNMKLLFCRNWLFYLIGCAVLLGLKLFYRSASADDLKWMLAPVSWWAGILSCTSFTYVPMAGYVSHSREFIIAPSCSGMQFWLIAIAVTLFSYVHRMPTRKTGVVWSAASIMFSWLYTIFVNGIRIVLSVYLPLRFHARGLFTDRFTPEKLHTMTGTAVYFSALMLLCQIGGYISGKVSEMWSKKIAMRGRSFTSPEIYASAKHAACVSFGFSVVWYLLIVLGIPFLSRVWRNDWTGFGSYALIVLAICLTLSLPVSFFSVHSKFKRSEKFKS